MQVVVLAAGLGSRLGALTQRLPKALIEVGGETLLARAVRFAERLAPSEIIVVGGFGFASVAAETERKEMSVTLIENPAFRDGNLVSLLTVRDRVTGELVLMNVDHIYKPAVASLVARPVQQVTAFVDVDRHLGPDDMKVSRDERGHLREIAKSLVEFDSGYVGMTRVPDPDLGRYWGAVDSVHRTEGSAVHVERVLAHLARQAGESGSPEQRPACRDISGIGWLEVDLREERDHADLVVRAAPDVWS